MSALVTMFARCLSHETLETVEFPHREFRKRVGGFTVLAGESFLKLATDGGKKGLPEFLRPLVVVGHHGDQMRDRAFDDQHLGHEMIDCSDFTVGHDACSPRDVFRDFHYVSRHVPGNVDRANRPDEFLSASQATDADPAGGPSCPSAAAGSAATEDAE